MPGLLPYLPGRRADFLNTVFLRPVGCSLRVEKSARLKLEERVSRLERNVPSTTQQHDLERAVAVIGGFGQLDAQEAKHPVSTTLADVDGLQDAYSTNPDPAVLFAQFASAARMHKFVRATETPPRNQVGEQVSSRTTSWQDYQQDQKSLPLR